MQKVRMRSGTLEKDFEIIIQVEVDPKGKKKGVAAMLVHATICAKPHSQDPQGQNKEWTEKTKELRLPSHVDMVTEI